MASAIIVFSHLRWDFVFQRSQHVLLRLARHHPIVFIEEPVHDEKSVGFKTYTPAQNVFVCQPHTPIDMPGFHDGQLPHLRKMLRQLVCDYDDHIAWLYTPMALPLLQELRPKLVVYDCMDELSAFRNAPRQLAQRENAVLKVADIVFTAGQSLYHSKHRRHPNIHCVPNSVDASHFLPALDRSNSHSLHRDIPGPRLGFYGVIDERFDAELIAKVADAHTQWQIVLVGPVIKIDPATLPRRPNIHYLGQQPYEALPHFLAGWDVCLLPFAINESTRFISPVKTLEYMAAELPIVSTPINDVVSAYGDVVTIAGDAQSFISACEAALLAPLDEQAQKIERMREVLASTSWDSTVERMRELIDATPRRRAGMDLLSAASFGQMPRQEAVRHVKTAIIGAGPTGLSAAYHLGHEAVLLERNSMVGGWCRPIKVNGFTFDHAANIMCSDDPYVLELYDRLLGSNLHWQDREACVYSKGAFKPYPFRDASQQAGKNARFGYPLRGGLQALMSAFVPHIKGTIELNAEVVRISPKQQTVTLADGRRYQYEHLISTMPLPELVKIAGDEAPEEVRQAASALRHVSVRCIDLGVARENITDKHWIYFPEDAIFHRIFVQGNASPECNAPGGFGLTCEITYSPSGKSFSMTGSELVERCVHDCIKVGLLREDDRIIATNEVDIPYVYVVYDQARARNVEVVKNWFVQHGVVLAGRYAEWEHYNSDHAFVSGKKAADAVRWVEPRSALAE